MRHVINFFLFFTFIIFFVNCNENKETELKAVIFEGYHPLLDKIILSKQGVYRGLSFNCPSSAIIKSEAIPIAEKSEGHLFYEYIIDSVTNYAIKYNLEKDSLQEINVQINCNDLELSSYLFCDLKDYYANKLQNFTEEKGIIIYNALKDKQNAYTISLTDNSSPVKGVINICIYKDK